MKQAKQFSKTMYTFLIAPGGKVAAKPKGKDADKAMAAMASLMKQVGAIKAPPTSPKEMGIKTVHKPAVKSTASPVKKAEEKAVAKEETKKAASDHKSMKARSAPPMKARSHSYRPHHQGGSNVSGRGTYRRSRSAPPTPASVMNKKAVAKVA